MAYYPKMLIIGLDGADFMLVREWMRQGRLPNLRALAGRGRWGRLESTVPPVTAPAWTTMYTGVTPARHRLYNFWEQAAADVWAPAFADTCAVGTMWKALNDVGISVGLFNLPWTYPVEKLNRFCVAGLSPVHDARVCYPPEVFSQMTEWCPGWRAEVMGEHARFSEGADRHIRGMTETEADVGSRLFRHWQPDVAMLVLRGPDTIVHATPDEEAWRSVFEKVDEVVGRLVGEFGGPQTHVAVVSDHGGRRAEHPVNLVRVFADAGLLVPERRSSAARAWGRCWASAGRIARWMSRQGIVPARRVEGARKAIGTPRLLSVDWARTAAIPLVVGGGSAVSARINLAFFC